MWPGSLWRVGWKQWTAYSMLCSAQETQRIQIFPTTPPPDNLTEITSFDISHSRLWSSGPGQVGELVFSVATFGRRSWNYWAIISAMRWGASEGSWWHYLTSHPHLPSLWQGKWCGDSYWDIMAVAWLSPSSSIEMERTLKCIININQKSCQSSQIKAHNAVLTTQADKRL